MKERPTISLDDLEFAVEWASAGAGYGTEAYICRRTGRIYTLGHDDPKVQEEVPDDIGDPALYEEVPSWRDLDMSKYLVIRYVREHMPDKESDVYDIFSRSGAFSRFKEWINQQGQLESWYAYEAKAKKEALIEWASEKFDPR